VDIKEERPPLTVPTKQVCPSLYYSDGSVRWPRRGLPYGNSR